MPANQHDSAPFSGDVHQAINPWSWAASIMQQAGFININNFESSAPNVEKDIIENIAGYGKQIDSLNQLMDIVLSKIDTSNLTEEQTRAMTTFQQTQYKIQCLKESRKKDLTILDMEKIAEKLTAVKTENNEKFQQLFKILTDAVDD